VSPLAVPELSAEASEPGIGEAPPSPAGPVTNGESPRLPPGDPAPTWLQTIRFAARPISANLRNHRRYGDVWRLKLLSRTEGFVVTCHPDHVRSLMKASPQDAPSLTGESPLRPILGPDSILTSVGERHMRQRKLLLPPFHGESVQRYVEMISEVAEREINSWPLGEPFALAPRMSAVTLDVIMSGIFGIEGKPPPGTTGYRTRRTIRRLLAASTHPLFQVVELQNARRREPAGILRVLLGIVDRRLLAMIAERRAEGAGEGERTDVLSLLLHARDEDGAPLTDSELRDELLSLVLAGHETTANSLAWIFERLLRMPPAYDRLRELTRAGGPDGDAYVEATIHEGMRVRPVIPMIVRMVTRPWRFGDYVLPARTPVAVSIVALHHREDVYPDPLAFRPERFLHQKQPDDPGDERSGEAGRRAFIKQPDDPGDERSGEAGRRAFIKQPDDPGDERSGEAGRRAFIKPGTYTWMPFGGGIRRCLGASLAMAEQRVVVEAIARRTDLRAAGDGSEHARQRNVTTIPSRGGRVVVTRRDAA
jgi:cytochrome P450